MALFTSVLSGFEIYSKAQASLTMAFVPGLPVRTEGVSMQNESNFLATGQCTPVYRPAGHSRRAVLRASLVEGTGMSYMQTTAESTLRSFLTRRAVRTIAWYYTEFRDPASRDWMLKFEDFDERERTHNFFDQNGLFLYKMFHAEPVKATVVVGHARQRALQRTYTVDIRPHDVANRIVAARAQLAEEWARDLRCIALENKEILRMSIEKTVENNEKRLNALREKVFDSDNAEDGQTPLRYKNYTKLKLLATQQAISRFQLELRDTNNHDYLFFHRFVGVHEPLSNDEYFILKLWNERIVRCVNPDHEIVPALLAKRLLEIRAEIAEEWISALNDVPEEHAQWSRIRLEEVLSINMTKGEDFPDYV